MAAGGPESENVWGDGEELQGGLLMPCRWRETFG